MQEAILNYEKDLKSTIFLNPKQTDCKDYYILKQAHHKLRDESLTLFKEKAVGQNLKDFENKIFEEIQKKYLSIKTKCIEIYQQKCQDST